MESVNGTLRLKQGREKPVQNRHPWIFSGAIAAVEGPGIKAGDLVDITNSSGKWLARAYYNPDSQIAARILSWNPDEIIDDHFWADRLSRAVQGREQLELIPQTTAYRLVNAESDGLPGFIVDRYDQVLVLQCLTAGIEVRRQLLVEKLLESTSPTAIIERSDVRVRKMEGLEQISGVVYGNNPSNELEILENGHRFLVDLYHGQKTGFYLDQRENRTIVCRKPFTSGGQILNVFAYTGAFSVYAAANEADKITNVDISGKALDLAQRNIDLNEFQRPQDEYVAANAFEVLRTFRDEDRQFDMVILDPPKFAHRRRDLKAATRGYKDLNWLAMRIIRSGGLLATFSCSGSVSEDLFQKIVFGAAVDARRDVQIIKKLAHSPDHPVLLSFPESAYLKGFLCRVY